MKTMCLVFAHPDDESFFVGGTVAKYAKLGWKIDLIVATNGEAGNNSLPSLEEGQTLGDVRKKELQ